MSSEKLADEFVVMVSVGPGGTVCVDLLTEPWDAEDIGMAAALASGILGVWAFGGYVLPMVAFVGGYVVAYMSLAWLTRAGMAGMADRAALPLLCDMLDERYAGKPEAEPRIELTVFDETKSIPTWLATLFVGATCCAAQAILPATLLVEAALCAAVVLLHAKVLGSGGVVLAETKTDRAGLRALAIGGEPLRNVD